MHITSWRCDRPEGHRLLVRSRCSLAAGANSAYMRFPTNALGGRRASALAFSACTRRASFHLTSSAWIDSAGLCGLSHRGPRLQPAGAQRAAIPASYDRYGGPCPPSLISARRWLSSLLGGLVFFGWGGSQRNGGEGCLGGWANLLGFRPCLGIPWAGQPLSRPPWTAPHFSCVIWCGPHESPTPPGLRLHEKSPARGWGPAGCTTRAFHVS